MIDTAAIRNKLMHLAVSGNLVEHDIEDGNASELVEKISHEINGSSRREVAIDEIPYEIPENWTWCRLSDIGSTNIGLTYHPEDVVIDGIPVLRSNNIKNNKLIFDDLIKVNCEIREKQYIGENDILICARNGSKALVGKCAIYSGELGLTSFGAFMAVYRTQCFEYVYYYFQTKVFRRYFENENNKQINQVTQSILKDAIIPLPPIKEQKRIVEKINKVFELLDVIDEMQQQYSSDLEVLKSKIIDAGIQGKLTEQLPEDGTAEELLEQIADCRNNMIKAGKIKKPKDIKNINREDIPFEIPNTWKWEKWGNIINVVSARRVHQSDWRKEGIPFYRAREIAKLAVDGTVENDLFISQELYDEFSKDRVPQPGDLMVSAVGTLGKSYVVKEGDLFYYKDASVLCFENYGGMNPYYLRYLMQSSLMKNQIESNSGGTTVDTLTMVRMVQYILPIPPLNEQDRIVSQINEILELL